MTKGEKVVDTVSAVAACEVCLTCFRKCRILEKRVILENTTCKETRHFRKHRILENATFKKM